MREYGWNKQIKNKKGLIAKLMLLSRRLVISSKYQNFQLSKYTKRSKSPPILSFPWNSFCLFFSLDNKMFNGKGKSTPLVYYIPSTFSGILHDSSSPLKRIISFLLLCVRLLFKTLSRMGLDLCGRRKPIVAKPQSTYNVSSFFTLFLPFKLNHTPLL